MRERALLDQHVAARVNVHAVVVGEAAVHADAAHGRVVGVDEMVDPERRVGRGVAFEQDAPAAEELDERRAQVRAFPEHALLERHAVEPHPAQALEIGLGLRVPGMEAARWLPSIVPGPVMATSSTSRA